MSSIILSTSCHKDVVDEFTPISEHWDSVDQFFGSVEQIHTIIVPFCENEFVIEREKSLLHFKENSFTDLNGQAVSGTVQFQLSEIKTSGEMLLNGLHSKTVDNEILYSKSVYKYQLAQNGMELKLSSTEKAAIYIESEDTQIDTEATFNWVQYNDSKGWFPTSGFNVENKDWNFDVNSKNYTGSGYKFTVENLGWLHMGDFEGLVNPNDDQFGSLQISVPDAFANSASQVFVCLKNKICAIPLDLVGSKFNFDRVLIGEEMTVVFLSVKDSELYYGEKHIISGENNSFDIMPTKSSYLDVYSKLKDI